MTELHSGGKFDKNSYKVSGGLHGVGVSVVNALSETLELEIKRDGAGLVPDLPPRRARVGRSRRSARPTKTGTKVRFVPDPQIFAVLEFNYDTLAQRLRELSFLNRGVHIRLRDERTDKAAEFAYAGGIASFVEHLNRNKKPLHPKPIYLEDTRTTTAPARSGRDRAAVERRLPGAASTRFTNTINNRDGGTHLEGFKAALTRTINAYAAELRARQAAEGDDALRRRRPRGPDRGRLGQDQGPEVLLADQGQAGLLRGQGLGRSRSSTSASSHFLEENPRDRAAHRREVRRGGAGPRGGAQGARADAPQGRARRARTSPASSPTARSATPSSPSSSWSRATPPAAPPSRAATASFQAILPLKGKILNVEKARFDKMLSSEEIKTIITALGTGIGKDDFDLAQAALPQADHHVRRRRRRQHIRTLILTFFYRQMREVIARGHLYIAQPPLYKVAQGKNESYLKDDREYQAFLVERIQDSWEIGSRPERRRRQDRLRGAAPGALPSRRSRPSARTSRKLDVARLSRRCARDRAAPRDQATRSRSPTRRKLERGRAAHRGVRLPRRRASARTRSTAPATSRFVSTPRRRRARGAHRLEPADLGRVPRHDARTPSRPRGDLGQAASRS